MKQRCLGHAVLGFWVVISAGGCSTFGDGGAQTSGDLTAGAGRIAEMQSRLEENSRRLTGVEADLTELARQISGLDLAVRRLRADLQMIEAEAAGEASRREAQAMRSRIQELERQMAGQSAELAALSRSVEDLRGTDILEQAEAVAASETGTPEQAGTAPDAADATESEAALTSATGGSADTADDYGIHLASYRDAQALRDGWIELQARHRGLIGGMDGRVEILDLDEFGGRYYRLLAGPIDTRAEADRICRELQDAGGYCEVTRFTGEALSGAGE